LVNFAAELGIQEATELSISNVTEQIGRYVEQMRGHFNDETQQTQLFKSQLKVLLESVN
jgi:phage-related protein